MKELEIFKGGFATPLPLPFADMGIQAGFPSPAQDYIDRSLDFNRELIEHPAATFYAKVVGMSMRDAGITDGDIVVIDRAVDAEQDDIVVVFIDGEFTIKYIDFSEMKHNRIWLRPANPDFEAIKVTATADFRVWGVVVKVIKSLK
ncbi:MAG: translesion error-prone DNA polymerase V autoproteolytic subunit [Muribaculaceae bacterium]|nr:translesion error-prone DNA polymerase V autoproteolytic subunit [Muribaculaceae bacterium]